MNSNSSQSTSWDSGRWRANCAGLLLATAVFLSAGEKLCFHAPGPNYWEQGDCPNDNVPPCSMNVLNAPGIGINRCQPAYEPSYQYCENVSPPPNAAATKYWGKCVMGVCDFVTVSGGRIPIEANYFLGEYSRNIGWCTY